MAPGTADDRGGAATAASRSTPRLPMQTPRLPLPLADDRATPWTDRTSIGGFTPSSTRDWPGMRAATVFVMGCPWRCAYCHNPHLQPRQRGATLDWSSIAGELERCHGLIDGVVFSGGEPTSDRTLPEQVRWVRERGLRVGLHTNGAYPARLCALLPLLDWVGLDLKTGYDHYDALTGARGSADRITESARALVDSGVDHEFRLTWHHEVVTEPSAMVVARFAQALGARRFVLQSYCSDGVTASAIAARSAPPARLLQALGAMFGDFQWRQENCGLDLPCAVSPET